MLVIGRYPMKNFRVCFKVWRHQNGQGAPWPVLPLSRSRLRPSALNPLKVTVRAWVHLPVIVTESRVEFPLTAPTVFADPGNAQTEEVGTKINFSRNPTTWRYRRQARWGVLRYRYSLNRVRALLEAQNMLGFRFFCALVLVSMIAIPSKANSRAAFRDAGNTRADAQSNQEFRAQVAAIVQSYRKGDATGGRQMIEQFRLPNAKDWFSEHLNPADSAEFVSRYDRLYVSFAESFELTVKDIVATRGAELGTEVELGEGETPPEKFIGKRSGVVSTKAASLFFCTFQITIKKSPATSWGETYVRQDGAFRFLGSGGWPFWVWQNETERRASSHFATPPVLISRVDPDYPLQAKADKVEGVVIVRIRIDKDGRVEKAEVISGDPRLSQAALDAVRQWRYKPATIAGAPLSNFEATVNINFSLH